MCMYICEKHGTVGYGTRDGTMRIAGVVLWRDGKAGEVIDYIQHGSRSGFMGGKKQGDLGRKDKGGHCGKKKIRTKYCEIA